MFAQAMRGYLDLHQRGEDAAAEAILAWLAGQPNVAAGAKREAGVKGEIDHDGALTFLKGLLAVLRDSGHAGLVLVMDEVETLQRMRSDVRDKSLNALRQFMDELSGGLFPGLYLVRTGTPAFFAGPAEFDNPRAPQIRLPGFTQEKLELLGRRVRDLFADGSKVKERVRAKVNDALIADFSRSLVGELGGKVGIAPRIFLRKLVTNVLDKVELFDTFEPREHGGIELSSSELTREEAAAVGRKSVEEIELDLSE